MGTISQDVFAYDYGHRYDLKYLTLKFEKFIPEGWRSHKIEIQYLDSIKNDLNGQEYIIVQITKSNLDFESKINYNKIYVFEWIGEDL